MVPAIAARAIAETTSGGAKRSAVRWFRTDGARARAAAGRGGWAELCRGLRPLRARPPRDREGRFQYARRTPWPGGLAARGASAGGGGARKVGAEGVAWPSAAAVGAPRGPIRGRRLRRPRGPATDRVAGRAGAGARAEAEEPCCGRSAAAGRLPAARSERARDIQA
jgi:hypothetical protein